MFFDNGDLKKFRLVKYILRKDCSMLEEINKNSSQAVFCCNLTIKKNSKRLLGNSLRILL